MTKRKYLEKALEWTQTPFDKQTRLDVAELIENKSVSLQDAFYKDLAFGTGGMRGIMGAGTNRVNKYTLGKATQGLSNYLKLSYPDDEIIKVVIAYDCRHKSDTLARTVAEVFSANGIKVYLYSELRTTPQLSYSVRHLSCHAGIVLTASHNPPEYNGYKVYWTDGGQIVPPQDGEIIAEINKLSFEDINFKYNDKLIEKTSIDVDHAFIDASSKNGEFGIKGKEKLKIVFTSLHGTSITAIPLVLKKAGYTNVTIIKEQEKPDGNFPTVKSPNPEEPEALEMAINKAEEVGADIVIGTDPDSDRLGIAVRNLDGKIELLNGNQTMLLMTKFLLDQRKQKGFTGNEFIASTIVSTPMMQILAGSYNVEYKSSLTGFKWIAKMIKDHPKQHFIGGGEESFGFMVGDFVRDKDAVTATLLACEIATYAKNIGSSFFEELITCYLDFGFYKERLVSLVKRGAEGAEEIKKMMQDFKVNPLKSIDGSKVILVDDYNTSTSTNLITGHVSSLEIPKSNVLIYTTEDGTKVAARPSGTEPKIKFYISVNDKLDLKSEFVSINQKLENKLDRIVNELGVV